MCMDDYRIARKLKTKASVKPSSMGGQIDLLGNGDRVGLFVSCDQSGGANTFFNALSTTVPAWTPNATSTSVYFGIEEVGQAIFGPISIIDVTGGTNVFVLETILDEQ